MPTGKYGYISKNLLHLSVQDLRNIVHAYNYDNHFFKVNQMDKDYLLALIDRNDRFTYLLKPGVVDKILSDKAIYGDEKPIKIVKKKGPGRPKGTVKTPTTVQKKPRGRPPKI